MGAEEMNENTVYWAWLSMALGAAARVDEILACYSSPKEIFEADRIARVVSGVFSRPQIERLEKTPLKNAQVALETCRRNGWKVYTPDDSDYPELLRHLTDMPLVLYVDGDISCVNKSICIGVVGTRKPSYESVKIARMLCGEMAAKNTVVVSGGALGIDSAAHEGALTAEGKTICVMGCGLGCGYLRENEPLRKRISQSGALVSEFPPLSGVTRSSFPIRNRIISGMSMGVLVVEAGERSGSLITARNASEQGRDVFAVPGSILNSAYTGVNRLIRDGAIVVTCADDIIGGYGLMYPDRVDSNASAKQLMFEEIEAARAKAEEELVELAPKTSKTPKVPPEDLDSDSLKVYGLFKGEPLHADEICVMSGLPAPKVFTALMTLEIENLIKATDGKCYELG